MRINIEAKPNTIYRWRGEDRILTTQDATNEGAAESLRMDLVSFTGREDHPVMDAEINPLNRPYTTPITFITNLNLAPGSRVFWHEAFALWLRGRSPPPAPAQSSRASARTGPG
jgi:hypothetical protein